MGAGMMVRRTFGRKDDVIAELMEGPARVLLWDSALAGADSETQSRLLQVNLGALRSVGSGGGTRAVLSADGTGYPLSRGALMPDGHWAALFRGANYTDTYNYASRMRFDSDATAGWSQATGTEQSWVMVGVVYNTKSCWGGGTAGGTLWRLASSTAVTLCVKSALSTSTSGVLTWGQSSEHSVLDYNTGMGIRFGVPCVLCCDYRSQYTTRYRLIQDGAFTSSGWIAGNSYRGSESFHLAFGAGSSGGGYNIDAIAAWRSLIAYQAANSLAAISDDDLKRIARAYRC